MDKSAEIPHGISSAKQKIKEVAANQMNRRTFLLGGLAAAIGAKLGRLMKGPTDSEVAKSMGGPVVKKYEPIRVPTQEPQKLAREIPDVVEPISAVNTQESPFYSKYSGEERNSLLAKVKVEKEEFLNAYSKDNLDIVVANCLGNQLVADQVLSEGIDAVKR